MPSKSWLIGGNNASQPMCGDDNGDGTITPVVSLGCSKNKTTVGATNTLASTANTADQVIVTYTVTAGKTFFLEWADVVARLTTFASTATYFGTASLEIDGTKVWTGIFGGAGITTQCGIWPSEPIAVASGKVIRLVCTPSSTTGYTWRGNIGGYEK